MAMVESELRALIVEKIGIQHVDFYGIDKDGKSTSEPKSVSIPMNSPLVTAIVQVINYIQLKAEVVGPVTITGASGGMVVGVGGGVPGPVTAALTGAVPVTGVATIPVTGIK
jgi:hypothetical protein